MNLFYCKSLLIGKELEKKNSKNENKTKKIENKNYRKKSKEKKNYWNRKNNNKQIEK